MGCFNSKDATPPSAWQYQEAGAGYTYHATYAQPPPPAMPGFAAYPGSQSTCGEMAQAADFLWVPFLKSSGPTGLSWGQFVQGGPCHIDGRGFLAGPWAECIQAAVHFEHHTNWNYGPEYVGSTDGPVGGVLTSLGQWLRARRDIDELMDAANRLEEAAHYAENNGVPLPRQAGIPQQPGPAYAPPMAYAQPYDYSQQPMGYAQPYGYPSPVCAEQYMAGPTLLQQHEQNQGGGMGTGAKVAMGVAAAGAGLAAGAFLGSHMDEVGGAIGDAGEWAGDRIGDAGDFLEDIF